jgi:hypothetical protein
MQYGILDVDRDAVAVQFAICAGRETLHGKKVPMVRVSEDLEVDIMKMLPSHGKLVAFDSFDVCRSISGIWLEVIVTGVRCYDIAVEAAAEADRKQMAQAMKVVESLTTPCKKKPRRCKEHSTMKRRLTHRAAELASVDLKHVFELASSDSSEEEVMEEDVEEWAAYAKGFLEEFDGQQQQAVDVGGINIGGWTYSKGKKVGRIQSLFGAEGDTLQFHISCCRHAEFSKTIPLANPPSRADLVRWLQHADAYGNAEDHLAALEEGKPFLAPAPAALAPVPAALPHDEPVAQRGGFVAAAGSRVVMIRNREFRELWPSKKHGFQELSGYSLKCKWHEDCWRDLSFGSVNPMSREECIERLLRWEATGTGICQDTHRDKGKSPLLRNFATSRRLPGTIV